ncbi:MAG TPA: LysE family transporter [Planctomycetota bacterium]|nr:LysE family transporter [Planctomycetota bacterium]
MALLVVLKAAAAAAAISLPPGPAVALCGAHLRRGLRAGALAALGAALADVHYGLLAAKGVAPLALLDPPVRRALAVALGVAFGVAGLLAVRRARRPAPPPVSGRPFVQGLFLALAAPGVLPGYVVLHAALGIDADAPFPLVCLGTVLGCVLAWGAILLALRRLVAFAPRVIEYVLPAVLLAGSAGILGSAFR